VRANQGLRSLDQAPLLRQRIRSAEAMGRLQEAWNLERALLGLARAHPEDLRTVPILREVGDRRMDLLGRYRTGGATSEVVVGCFYAPERAGRSPGACEAGSREVATQSILSEAQNIYLDAIRVVLRNRLYSSNELKALEATLVESSYEYGRYDAGRQSLRRLLAYESMTSGSLLRRIELLIEIADWDLIFEFNRASALEGYLQAYELLSAEGAAGEGAIERLFAPPLPVVLPAFLPNPLRTTQTAESAGHIDVGFEITKYGSSRNIEILATTNANKASADVLVALIARSRFRPRAADGQLSRAVPVTVRYYLNEPQH
jgi:hypothetical protein